MNNLTIKTKVIGGYVIILLLMVIVSTVSYNSSKSLIKTSNWVEHTHKVITTASRVGASIVDMETGKRGFLVTGDETYLEPYFSGINNFDNFIIQGFTLTNDNSLQLKRWKEIIELKDKWVTESAEPEIQLRKEMTINIENISEIMSNGLGKRYIDAIRVKIDMIIKTEEKLLEQRRTNQEDSANKATDIVTIGTMMAIIFGFYIAIVISKNIYLSLQKDQKKDKLLVEQSKLAAMGEMVGAIAHQWRQPLNSLALQTQFIEDDFEDGIIDKEYLSKFSKENMKLISFMSKTIDDFRNFFTIDKVKIEFYVRNKINATLNMLSSQMEYHQIEVTLSQNDFAVLGYESEFQQVILNLVNNSKDALLENKIDNPKIIIEIKNENNHGIIEVKDNAGGVPKDVINRVFEPYYTTKEEGKGTGLGLYMSKMIVEDNMNGKIKVQNSQEGAVFTIDLNIYDKNKLV